MAKKGELILEGIRQFAISTDKQEWKLDTLRDLRETFSITQATIYCGAGCKVDWLAEQMRKRDFTISTMRVDLDQEERDLIT